MKKNNKIKITILEMLIEQCKKQALTSHLDTIGRYYERIYELQNQYKELTGEDYIFKGK